MHQSFVCSHVPVFLLFLCDMAVTLLKQVSLWRLVKYSNKTLAQVVKLCGRAPVPSLEVLSSSLHLVRSRPQHSLSLPTQQSHKTVSQ